MSEAVQDRARRLRELAESQTRKQPSAAVVDATPESALLHELRVHQVELEIQNEELRQAQARLEASRDWASRLFHRAPIGYLVVDSDWLIVQANDAAGQLLGQEAARLGGRPFDQFLTDTSRNIFHARFPAWLRGQHDRTVELDLSVAGAVIAIRADVGVVDGAQGRPLGERQLLMAITDIRPQRAAIDALRDSEERARAIADHTANIEVWLGPEGQPLWVNPAVEETLGYSVAAAMGMPAFPLPIVHVADRPMATRAMERSDREPTTFRTLHHDGSERWLELTGRAITDQTGHPLGTRLSLRDVTRRLQLEEELRHAQKMETIGQLAGGVAHDFNNMLQIIIGHGEAAKELTSGETHEHLSQILVAAEHSSQLTRQLLTFARRQTVNPVILDLDRVIVDSEPMLRPLTGDGINLRRRSTAALWPIRLDRAQVEQVLMNLVANARDAVRDVIEPAVTISTENVDLPDPMRSAWSPLVTGRFVSLTVTDNGVGIPDDVRPHIFEPFFTTKELGKGTGLGLSTVYGIVSQNGGHAAVESVVGQGTSITVLFPRVSDARPEPVRPVANATKRPRGTETVLLVEDQPDVLALCRMFLSEYGYAVVSASDPHRALELAGQTEEPIDLLVTDVIMPGMNGKALYDALRLTRPTLKCLFMSGYASDYITNLGPKRDGVGFIAKPFSTHELVHAVRDTLAPGS